MSGRLRLLAGSLLFALLILLTDFQFSSAQSPNEIRIAINAGPEGDAVRKLVQGYPGAHVKPIALPYDTLREQLLHQLNQTQSTFDIVMIDDPWLPQIAPRLHRLDHIPENLRNDIVPASLHLGQFPYSSGPILALPFVGNTEILLARTDILGAFGVSQPPEDWQQVALLAHRITADSRATLGHQVYGYAIRGRAGAPIVTDFLPIYWSFGGKLVDSNEHPHSDALDISLFKRALIIYKELADASPPGAVNYDFTDMTAEFASGRAAMEINWPTAIPILLKSSGTSNSQRLWSVSLPPGNQGPGTSMIGNWLLGVPSNVAPNRAIDAEKLVLWLLQNQGQVAGIIDPPTRVSVFNQLASSPGADYFLVIRDALSRSTPRDRTPYWPQLENAVSDSVSGYLAGRFNIDEAADLLDSRIQGIYPKH